jgi:D-alanyl-D-alanine endopeptidase (penicillin-binding protein 7)
MRRRGLPPGSETAAGPAPGFGELRRIGLCLGTQSLLIGLALLALASPARALSVNAREAGVYDLTTGEWLYEKRADVPVPIASITKIAAALTFRRLTHHMEEDLDREVTITREDWIHAGKTRLRIGDAVPARTLLRLALVASDNCAARALAHPFGYTWEVYGYRMQETAFGLGCQKTNFVEPSGLDSSNVATVRDVVLLFRAALEDSVLREIMGTRQFQLPTRRGPRNIVHSSRLLRYRTDVTAAKTGYLAVAGYCLVQYVDDEKGGFITVILGAPTRGARIRESARLIDYTRRMRAKRT